MTSNSGSIGMAVVVTSVVFLIVAALSVVCRLIARVGILKNAGSDDITIVMALIAGGAATVAACYQVKHGLGQHQREVSQAEFSKIFKYLWASIISYNLSLTCIKASVILQYLRVFVGTPIRYWCWASIALSMVYGVVTVVTSIFTCTPISAFWTFRGKCIDRRAIWFFNAGFNIITDIIILVLPMPVLSSLRLPLKQKIVLMFIFALGGFVCLVSILRLHSMYIVSKSDDVTWDGANTAIWSNIEVMTGIICASMPATKALVSRFFPHFLSTNHSRQATFPSQGRSHNFRSALSEPAVVQLTHINGDHKTVTRVEVGNGVYGERDMEGASLGYESGNGNESRKDVFVTTSMTQDVERKSEVGSEKDLIIQHN
ncbi:hypothetical protein BKA65DRAFT_548927 [Rhexocercosporidium sp. MPI-PUGE-AT-0058]|nr:hypothetical protein BKA65DRAFT_548927 [Rhexocercosporidium sp. MPI-PUGE-AT-0058]